MNGADSLLGGGSDYGDTYRTDRFGRVPMTYEEALENYNDILTLDKVSGSYARYFCDYGGIMLGILPVFVSVAICLKDRRSGVRDLIYARQAASMKIVFTRYFAMVICCFLPILLFSGYLNGEISSINPNLSIDSMTVFRYAVGWLLPTLMTTLAVGMFLPSLPTPPSPFSSRARGFSITCSAPSDGWAEAATAWTSSPATTPSAIREDILDHFGSLVFNRVFYAVLALLLILGTAFLYEQKRRGKYHGIDSHTKIFRSGRQQSAA